LEREPDLLILDDFDKELENRNNDKHEENSIVNKILSVSDGLFHSKTKIIVTTNMSHTDIDPAIVRPGRCFDIIQIPSLSLEEAKKIWIDTLKQSQESFTESFAGYDSIKQAFLMSEYDKYRFANKTYLKDPSISVRGSYVGNKKTFGFTP
jgi:SpoVK/Ycf46/Vps4 family AAA+-type ATPase